MPRLFIFSVTGDSCLLIVLIACSFLFSTVYVYLGKGFAPFVNLLIAELLFKKTVSFESIVIKNLFSLNFRIDRYLVDLF